MKKQSPARISNSKLKKYLTAQDKIAKMIKRKSFKNVRQLIPMKEFNEMVNRLGLDKNSRKIGFTSLFRAIFYSTVVKNNSNSRSIASVGKTKTGQIFSRLPPVSLHAILDRLNKYDESKIDALTTQILGGLNTGIKLGGRDNKKVKVIDGTSIALSFSRTKDKLPKLGKNKKASEEKVPTKSLLKFGLTMQASSFIPLDW